MELIEMYPILYHENHPTRKKLMVALAEAGNTEEQISAALPALLLKTCTDNKSAVTDEEARNYANPK